MLARVSLLNGTSALKLKDFNVSFFSLARPSRPCLQREGPIQVPILPKNPRIQDVVAQARQDSFADEALPLRILVRISHNLEYM